MKRRRMWIILLVCILAFSFTGCGGTGETETDIPAVDQVDQADQEELFFELNAYTLNGGMLKVTYSDGTTEETGGYGLIGYAGETVGDALPSAGITAIEPFLEGDTFEGWVIFENVISVDEDGWELYSQELRSGDNVYTTEELVAMPIPEYNSCIVAKWASISLDSYFAEEDYMWEAGVTTGAVSLIGNEGLLHFQHANGSDSYNCATYTYWMEDGQSLNDLSATETWDTFVEAQKENAEFSGWTVYEGDSITWSSEAINDGTTISLPYDIYEGFEYIVLENGTEYHPNLSSEELCELVVEGKCYVAVANWK